MKIRQIVDLYVPLWRLSKWKTLDNWRGKKIEVESLVRPPIQ